MGDNLMKQLKIAVMTVIAAGLVVLLGYPSPAGGQPGLPTEAPTGFDNLTNGFTDQAAYDANREEFEDVDLIANGIGPVYNAQSCRECHQNPVTGSGSQVTELRAGHYNGRSFVDHPGGSLIHSRAINVALQEQLQDGNEVRALRISLNTLGDGFVECIADQTLLDIAALQPHLGLKIEGLATQVPVLEAGGTLRVGRFGWKNQHASLMSFSADAYLNEMGITSPLAPVENNSNGRSVVSFDTMPDPEDDGENVEKFASFIRATKAPPRGPVNASVVLGGVLFASIGCAVCHVPLIVTAPPGTVINGGQFIVPPALGNKIIHPYSDFLLHDVDTGDGIVQNGGQATRNRLRTAPLWGLRTRNRLMHDGLSLTLNDAILRHGGEASIVISRYRLLFPDLRKQIIAFLQSL
jgi:CxxC motif-containing protein (DUF1111 family)